MRRASAKSRLKPPPSTAPLRAAESSVNPASPPTPVINELLVCFFLSGAAALIYEVAWTKSLALLFGHTVYANATVLSVFMAGLAGGSAMLGRKSEKSTRPIALYGWVELGVGVAGAASLGGLAGVRWLYYRAYPLISSFTVSLLALRFVGATLVLLVPSFLMGGTLPILLRGLLTPGSKNSNPIGQRLSRLYWVNTLGAVGGAITAGFILLPALGLRLSIISAALVNIVVGGIALHLSHYFDEVSSVASRSEPISNAPVKNKLELKIPISAGFLLAAFGLVGGIAICYEIAWTRLLATILGSSTYSFTLMLATFLLGIALGSMLYELWSRRHKPSLTTFASTQTLTSGTALLFLVFFRELPRILPPILKITHESFRGLILGQSVLSALAMLPTAIVFGFNFPVVVALIVALPTQSNHPGLATGRAYALNTCGAIVGAVATGFLLLPRLGSFRVVGLASAISILLAVVLEVRSRPRRSVALLINVTLGACVVLVGWSSLFYDRALASFGTVLYWNYHRAPLTIEEAANTEDIVFFQDGLSATVSVARRDSYVALKTNGKVDASSVDANTQILLGDLGAIFHPRPRRVLVIGFGGGMTVSAVSRFPDVARIDCVEIEPAVLHAAPYLGQLNRGILRDARLNVILDDARNALLTSHEQYDLIISEPSNPWIEGVATLFTDEFYVAVQKRLAPGGVFVQWVQGYSLEPSDLQMILATIAPHFVDLTLWHSAGADFLVLARTESAPLDFSRARTLWSAPQLQEDFSVLRLARPESWAAYFSLSDAEVRALAARGNRNTDDRTLLEYRAPYAMIDETRREELEAVIKRFQHGLLPTELRTSEIPAALEAAAETSFDLRMDRSADYVQALDTETPTASLEILRGRLAHRENQRAAAIAHFDRAMALEPQSTTAAYWLALEKHTAPGDYEGDALLTRILQLDPRNLRALASRVEFARDRRDWRGSARAQTEYIAAMEDPAASEYCRLGDLWARAGNLTQAEEAFRTGLEHEPYSYMCHRELGEIDRVHGRLSAAREHLEFVVRFYPEADSSVYPSLALVYRAQGQPDKAMKLLGKGHRIFPSDPTIYSLYSHYPR